MGVGIRQGLSLGTYDDKLGRVQCINYVLKGARNLPVTAIVRSTFYRLNGLFTRKSVEAHKRVRNGFM
ncbi:uncharacterized protein DS421_14g470620 [Arachis hypogaea]|nr:uncharacterized protein DS421_14g470620 [Arachis hypogaea]